MIDTRKLHPDVQILIPQFLADCYRDNLFIKINETFRTVKEQDDLYAQGRTVKGNIVTNARGSTYSSLHQWGIAVDFNLLMDVDGDGKISDDAFNDSRGYFKLCANNAKKLGFAWGGDWTSFADKPHIQLAKFSDDGSTSFLKKKYGTFANFYKTWGKSKVTKNWAGLTTKELKKLIDKRFNAKTKRKCNIYKKDNIFDGKYYSALPPGTYIKHLSDVGNGWSMIQYGAQKGYVKNSNISGISNLSNYKTAIVIKTVKLRSSRSVKTERNVLLTIPVGKEVKIKCVKNSWAQVKYNKKTGFVKKSRLQKK